MNIYLFIARRFLLWKPWNPQNRLESFQLQLTYLKYLGLWPPEDAPKAQLIAYRVYGWSFRFIFMYLSTLTQILYFMEASDFHVSVVNLIEGNLQYKCCENLGNCESHVLAGDSDHVAFQG